MTKRVRKVLRENKFLVDIYDRAYETYYKYFTKDEKFLSRIFHNKQGRELDLNNPLLYSDKLQWLKLYWRDSVAEVCADKFAVRKYVEDKIGENYLNEIYDVYDSVNEINLDKLPNKFVLKATHGSGYNVVCVNKKDIDWNSEFKKLHRTMKKNYYWENREWVYKNIKPRIISEKFLKQDDGDELRDYRFFCFNGEPKFITVDFSITDKNKTRRNLYDLHWNLLDAEISYPKETKIKVDKPNKLEEMILLSRKLSSGFPHARIDFYYIDNKIIFGEITFFHQSGMGKIKPIEFEMQMGHWLELPNMNGGKPQ